MLKVEQLLSIRVGYKCQFYERQCLLIFTTPITTKNGSHTEIYMEINISRFQVLDQPPQPNRDYTKLAWFPIKT